MISKEELYELYITQSLSMAEIAKRKKCAYSSINRYIKKYGIRQRTNGEHKKPKIANKKFGNWTAIKEVSPSKTGHTKWLFRCECGKELEIEATFLKQKNRTKCIKCSGIEKRNNFNRVSQTQWRRISERAKIKKIDLKVNKKYINSLLVNQNNKCSLTGVYIRFHDLTKKPTFGINVASLDRINPTKGYIKGNVHWVCSKINKIKSNFDINYFKYLCKCITENYKNINYIKLDTLPNKNLSNTKWNKIKTDAQKRNLEMSITKEYALSVFMNQGGICALSGQILSFPKSEYTRQKFADGTASLDRIDSSKGYIEGNIQWIHKDIQRMKWNFSDDELYNLCTMITNYDK